MSNIDSITSQIESMDNMNKIIDDSPTAIAGRKDSIFMIVFIA